MDDIMINIERDIRELKTAQPRPSTFTTHIKEGKIAAGRYDGFYFWRIHYQDVGDTNAPITTFAHGSGFCLREYNQADNTQDIELWANNLSENFDEFMYAESSRPITLIEQLTPPGPLEEWRQVRNFDPAAMGTTPGWCLQNCRLGFGGPYGNFSSARADMESQQANGTLHAEIYPPDYLAVPVYIDNGSWDGHVGVWDHGTFYSDGIIINDFVSYYGAANIYGWGELCDGWRVVEHV